MERLQGKIAIVTGAAQGQGAAEARQFVNEGCRVVIADVRDEQGAALADELGDAARYVHADVSIPADWDAAVQVARDLGGLHVLVNNAGLSWLRPLELETPETMERMWRVNLLGPFLGIRAAAPAMRDSGGGSIINISSVGGMTGIPYNVAYGTTKWGLRGLTRVAAIELGKDRIRVNSVHPGPINTDLLPIREHLTLEQRFGLLPVGRVGEPEDVASVVTFLASDESAFMTGAELVVDGGSQAGPAITYEWDPSVNRTV
jgi:3alpha(or 20beta)-hydroxysteroid dehydrogenase